MKISVGIATAGVTLAWQDTVRFVQAAEQLGVDFAWSAEAWGRDAVVPIAYLAACTSSIRLGTGIMQVTARAPTMTAMTAMTLDEVSGGRFALGLGASGPQVVEALQGIDFEGQLQRVRESVEVARIAFRGDPVAYQGRYLQLPGGGRRALRIGPEPRPSPPIYLGSLTPAGLRMTGELADGWLGQHYLPEAAEVFLGPIEEGARKAGRSLAEIDLQAGGWVQFGDDIAALVDARRPYLAFNMGAMGSLQKNFYTETYARAGFEGPAREAQRLWLAGERDKAVAAIPDEMVLQSQLVGPESRFRERVAAYVETGIDTIRLQPAGSDVESQLTTLTRAVELVREVAG